VKLTRNRLSRARQRVSAFLMNERNALREVAVHAARGACTLDYRHAAALLRRVGFDVESDDDCWASTDGREIWLSPHRIFDDDTLFYTLLHEVIHGMVRRSNGHELSEWAEHRMMLELDERLL